MGNTESNERQLFIGVIFFFFSFVQEQCPWFPEESTVNLDTWVKVKKKKKNKQLKTYPINMIKNVLDPHHEAVGYPMGEAIAVDGSGSPPSVQIIFSAIDKEKEGDCALPPEE